MTNSLMLQMEEMEDVIAPGDSTWFWGAMGGAAFLTGVYYGAAIAFT